MPKNVQWVWLLLACLFFYCCSSPVFLVFLGASGLITYGGGLFIGRLSSVQSKYISENELDKQQKKAYKAAMNRKKLAICSISVILNVGILFFVKYVNFFGSSIAQLFNGEFTALSVIVPLGISFYTFQSTGYVIDVYRGMSEPERNPLKYLLFLSFFPQIIQGPIAKYNDLAPQLTEKHAFDYDTVKSGLLRMLWGYFKKLVIADRANLLVQTVFGNAEAYGGCTIMVAAVFYAIQLYADFSGCMDIAIGCGEALGISMAENFRTPYFSTNVAEFWRRWHITLGAWFRDYVFYPISRVEWLHKFGKSLSKVFSKGFAANVTTAFGLVVVWLATGLWHGADWHFVVWGAYYGALIILSMFFEPLFKKFLSLVKIKTDCFSYKLFQIIRTFALVCIGHILFRADSISDAALMIKKLFTEFDPWVLADRSLLNLGLDTANMLLFIFAVAVLFCVSLANENGIIVRKKLMEQNLLFQWLCILTAIFAVLIFGIYGPDYNAAEFIYMGF